MMQEIKTSERLRKDADSIWKEILNHPFVVELYEGTLPVEKFKFYVLQDYNYLVTMMRNFSVLASRAESVETIREMLEIAYLEATSEFESYEELLKQLGYTVEDAMRIELRQMNISYISFLLATSLQKTFLEGLAATLPCFWTYAEIAEFHKDKLSRSKNSLYVEWASVYLSEPYRNLVNKMKELLDNADIKYEKLKEVFTVASK